MLLCSVKGGIHAAETTVKRQQGKINSLPWNPVKKEVEIKGLFHLHAEECGSHCSLYVAGGSMKGIQAIQLTSGHVLDKMPSWRRGFNLGSSEHPNLRRIPPWSRSSFSPWLGNTIQVILGQQEGIHISCSPTELPIVPQRLWDPGIVTIQEVVVLVHVKAKQLIFVLLEHTNQHMVHATKIIAYFCSMDLLMTYQSICAFQVDFSLVDESIATTSFELDV
jgi:hypothetical protein